MSDINNDRATDGDRGGDNKVIGGARTTRTRTGRPPRTRPGGTPSDEKQRRAPHRSTVRTRSATSTASPSSARDLANQERAQWVRRRQRSGVTRRGALENIDIAYDAAVTARDNARKAYYDATTDSSVDAETLRKLKERYDATEEFLKETEEHRDDLEAHRVQRPIIGSAGEHQWARQRPQTSTLRLRRAAHQRTTAIVSSGNPDTASYVSTLVPGIGTHVAQATSGEYMDAKRKPAELRRRSAGAGSEPRSPPSPTSDTSPPRRIPDDR